MILRLERGDHSSDASEGHLDWVVFNQEKEPKMIRFPLIVLEDGECIA
jgi:hypothetical protein